MISQPWIGGYSRETSLKPWLDPDNRGARLIEGAKHASLMEAPQAPQYSTEPASGGGSGGGGALSGFVMLWLAVAGLCRRCCRQAA